MTKAESALLHLFSSMDSAGQAALTEYAKFLAARHPAAQFDAEPLDIPRPESENVVAAIKRLSATYPMLDKQALLHETSTFMMQHMMQGREAVVVIDDMEVYFSRQYERHCQRDLDVTDA